MRNSIDNKVQNRRQHRPVYVAPTAVHLQHYSSKSYDSGDFFGDGIYDDDDNDFIEDLKIPLFVHLPRDDNLRLPITSPPCSNGSEPGGTLFPPAVSQSPHPIFRSSSFGEEQRHNKSPRSSSFHRSFRKRIHKAVSSVFIVVSDFLLLIFVCVMGLFFHVEVQVVKERARARRGRITIQQSSSEAEIRQHQYHSTDLLRPLHQVPPSSSLLAPDDMV
jgi:hypothetical protein